MLFWFGLAAMALIVSLVFWWAEQIQRENARLRKNIARLELEQAEERDYANRALRDFSPEDPATVLLFPSERA